MTQQLSDRTIAIVGATVPALTEHGTAITEAMYRRLFEDPEIAALFNEANQKTGAQVHALAKAVLAYARNIQNLGVLGPTIERIAQKHIAYAILPKHYPYVATALLGAIEEVLGDAATPDILAAWGEAYWFLADILKGREATIRKEILTHGGGWNDWRRFVVAGRRKESETVTSFILRPEDRGPVLAHKPGQYLTFRFDEAGQPGLKRNYSISCGPNADHYRISVKRERTGEASVFLHDEVKIGTVLECTPPAGDFFLPSNTERPVVLLSGGVGLTPMVSMLEEIADRHLDLPTFFVHGTTDRSTHALDAHVRELAARHANTKVAVFYKRPDEATDAEQGYVTVEWLRENTPFHTSDFYLCGPRPFLRFLVSGLKLAGIVKSRIHYEFFGPSDELLAT